MLIPKTLRINGKPYRVEQPVTIFRVGRRGSIAFELGIIEVAQRGGRPVRKLKPAERSETFWHEVTHGILHDMGAHKLCNDERFVKDFSWRLNNAIRSAKF